MSRVVVIVGLPGSGKTTFARTLGGTLVDDATQHPEQLEAALRSDAELVVITDVNAIYSRKEIVLSHIVSIDPKWKVDFICFENDPDSCWANLCARGDNKVSRGSLNQMARVYCVSLFRPNQTLPVWQR